MKFKHWSLTPGEEDAFASLRAQGVPALVAAVLCARGFVTLQQATDFLSRHPSLLCDPLRMRDMQAAVSRICLALSRGEAIAVYGDYDVDGITSTCLLTHYLRARGGRVCYYIPCRLEEGYGLNCDAMDALHEEGISLIITVDCGITATLEADYAKTLGMDMIITDHHECKEALPQALAVLNPHRNDCDYPFGDLAGVGVALKLVLALAGPDQHQDILTQYADLVALGTVADVMKLLGENRALVCMGLSRLKTHGRVGLVALMEEAGVNPQTLNSTTVGYCLAPRINAAGRMGKASLAAELILTDDPLRAKQLSAELCELNRQRQAVELDIFTACTEALDKESRHDSIVLAADGWHQGVVGIVASRLTERYACPVFMISLQDGKGKGSCRSYGGFHLFHALEACGDLLEGYGGHALAAGFTILEAQIPAFRDKIQTLVRADTGGEEVISTLALDAQVPEVSALTVEEVAKLTLLEPYGNGNAKPVFYLPGVTVSCLSEVGGGRHLKLRVCRDGRTFDAIFFSLTRLQSGVQIGDVIDLAFFPQVNEFRGTRSVQLHLVDLRPSLPPSASEEDARLYARFCRGEILPLDLVHRITPAREEFTSLWRYLASCGGVAEDSTELICQKAGHLGGVALSVTRTRVCLDVLEECGLVQLEHRNGRLRIRSRARAGVKMDLEQTNIMQRLRQYSTHPE